MLNNDNVMKGIADLWRSRYAKAGPWCPTSCHYQGDGKAQDCLDDCKDRYKFVSRMGGIASEIPKRAMKK